MKDYNEEEIVQRCIGRDRLAQSVFYRHHFAYLMSICLRYARNRDEAMEVLNLAFAKIMLSLNKLQRGAPLNPWMRAITINCIVDEFRKKALYQSHVEIHGDSFEFLMKSSTADETNNLEEVVQKILSNLHPTTRSVFNLYVVDGYRHREIGDMLGISEGTSAWHCSEARKVLKRLLSIELKP